jgi:phosphoribosylglycinamide formyltransferase-1
MTLSGEEFVSEPLVPAEGSGDASAMARGEPGMPRRFAWRGAEHAVTQVLRSWKSSTPERGEMYLRRHWFEILTDTGQRMTIYCERQARNRRRPQSRWWVYAVSRAGIP